MAIQVTDVTMDGDAYVLTYQNPLLEPGTPHTHYMPVQAVQHRMALYGIGAHQAMAEIIHEHLSTPDRDRDKFPTKADRAASKAKWGAVTGHTKADVAGLKALDRAAVVADLVAAFGADHVQKVRGQ